MTSGSAPHPSFKYSELSRRLAERITSGRYKPGDRLPSDRDIAETYGASRATVTKALKELEHAGLIQRKQGSGTYVLESRSLMRVALLIPGLQPDDVFTSFQHALSRFAGEQVQMLPNIDDDDVDRVLARLTDLKPQAAIVVPRHIQREEQDRNQRLLEGMNRLGVTVLLLDRDITPHPQRSDYDLIGLDHEQAGYDLGRHLVDQGCRRAVFYGQPGLSSSIAERLAGVRRAWAGAGLDLPDSAVTQIDWDDLAQAASLLREHQPDVVICGNDYDAALAMRSLMRLDVDIPGQVKITGFDDRNYAALLAAPLTTVAQPVQTMAHVCLTTLRQRIEHPGLSPLRIQVRGELRVRESTGAAQ